MKIDFRPTIKQKEVFDLFEDSDTTTILFGGGVGSAKSYLIAALTTYKCLAHPGIRVGLARNELTTLKKTTINSFMEVFESWGLTAGKGFNYNSTAGLITFTNGSEIVLQELRYLPSDPSYTRLGGLLLTFAVIDEAGECDEKGKEIFQSRCGRWKNDKYNIKPMLLMTCNPSRNFLYSEFYLARKTGTMPSFRAFVSATVYDNPYISKAYIKNLKNTLSYNEIQRLLLGNWEFDGDPNSIITLDDIRLMYDVTLENIQSKGEAESETNKRDKTKYLSADIAFTRDSCIIMVWEGLHLIKIHKVKKGDNVEDQIKKIAVEYGATINHISYDSDGVGKYLMQYLGNARAIINNAKPFKGENYKNLKTQLYFRLAKLIGEGTIKILDKSFKKEIEEELMSVKRKPRDTTDGKIEMNSKADVKKMIGRSPDFSDAMAYRMIFEYSNPRYVFM